jgi:hypothetical protein
LHRQLTSTHPNFVVKVRDVIGLYVLPPERAIVLCGDEKSQIQVLDRSQRMLPMHPGQRARRSHDYTGTAPRRCFAALDIVTGRVGRHRAAEFRKFLDEIEAARRANPSPTRHGQLRHAQNRYDPKITS